jgi:3-methyl-2-oxobutanoate hydroxymethyltransferase
MLMLRGGVAVGKTMATFLEMKRRHEPIAMLTCYDYPTAVLQSGADIDVLLVGDSVGTNVLGYRSEIEVTLGDICHHVRAVRRGMGDRYLLGDLPYHTYEDEETGVASAQQVLAAGANGVKLEGIRPNIVGALARAGIDVCAHIGLSMQSGEPVGIKGKTFEQARALVEGAVALERAGAKMMVLELMPAELADLITKRLTIPTIGIGAGPNTDGQVLVVHDLLGITPRPLRHAVVFAKVGDAMREAFRHYREDVKSHIFPGELNYRHLDARELDMLREWLDRDFEGP